MAIAGISIVILGLFLAFLVFGYSIVSEFHLWIADLVGNRKQAILPTLVVGNLTVGGSGKTPFVQYLSTKLQSNAVLLRGYRRKTKGFLEVNPMHSVLDVGDEALEHFHQGLRVFVGEKRLEAVEKIHQIDPNLELVILDDGLQHVALNPHCSLLLTDYQFPFWKEKFSIPFGKLRQFKGSANGFDAWVVTKCPENISTDEINQIRSKSQVPVFFASYKTSEPVKCHGSGENLRNQEFKWGLITGIVNGGRLKQTLERRDLKVVKHWEYSDHYLFKLRDIKFWISESKEKGIDAWVCSRKDFMRMKDLLNEIVVDVPIFEVHTEVEILHFEEKKLLNLIESKTQK